MSRTFGLDAYSPDEVAERVETDGVTKATLPILPKFMLGLLGGGFIGLGAMAHTLLLSDPDLGGGAGRVVAGVFFAMGYLVAISAGAQVFTTSNLVVMSWAAGKIKTRTIARHWAIILLANAIGAGGIVLTLVLAQHPMLHDGQVGYTAVTIAADKANEPFRVAFFKGVLGNLLIAIAVWLAMAGRTITDRFLAPLLPIAILPIAEFEHSVGNLFYLPMGLAVMHFSAEVPDAPTISILGGARNLVAVTLGNIFGGGLMVALAYHFIYRRNRSSENEPEQ